MRLLRLLAAIRQLRTSVDPNERAALKREIGCLGAMAVVALIVVVVQVATWIARTLATDGY